MRQEALLGVRYDERGAACKRGGRSASGATAMLHFSHPSSISARPITFRLLHPAQTLIDSDRAREYDLHVGLDIATQHMPRTLTLVATRAEHGKPDPEIYDLISRGSGVAPERCLVIEDSPAGVKAVLAAGMKVVAVATPFTREHLHDPGRLTSE